MENVNNIQPHYLTLIKTKELKLKQIWLAKKLNCTQPNVSDALRGKNEITRIKIERICEQVTRERERRKAKRLNRASA